MEIIISKAPEDPEEKKDWAHHLTRVQFAMWVDDHAKCAYCGHVYQSTDDMLDRNPFATGRQEFDEMFVDEECWPAYQARLADRTSDFESEE